ncbi:MAG TPA: hypothetical protein VF257_16420 [Solirubrobacteraceae bacterium]
MRRLAVLGSAVVATALACASPAWAVVPTAASYSATITGAVYEWNGLAGQYQQTAAVNLPALLFVEPRRSAPTPTSPVVGLFTGQTPALDSRPGAINFATNSQGFHVDPNVLGPTQAAIDVAGVQADPAAGTVQATLDPQAARAIQVDLFRTSASFVSAPAQILVGSMTLQFSADGRTVTGSFDLAGNGLIEPGNPLIPVKRYVANVSGTATAIQADAGGGGTGAASALPLLDRVRAPAGGLGGAARRGIAVTLSCRTACNVRATLSVSKALARRAHLAQTRVGSARASRASAGQFTLHVKLTRKARAALRGRAKVKVDLSVTVTTPDGVGHPFTKRLTLRGR